MVVDGQGQVWSGGDAGKVYKWEGQTPQAISVAEETHPEEIAGLCEDGQGRIWVGTSQSRFGWIEKNRFILLDECVISLRDRNYGVKGLLQDQDGVFWIGLYGEYRRFTVTRMVTSAQRIVAESGVHRLCQRLVGASKHAVGGHGQGAVCP